MNNLFEKVKEYLLEEYTEEEIIEDWKNCKVSNLTKETVTLTWDSDVIENLVLIDDKLVNNAKAFNRALSLNVLLEYND